MQGAWASSSPASMGRGDEGQDTRHRTGSQEDSACPVARGSQEPGGRGAWRRVLGCLSSVHLVVGWGGPWPVARLLERVRSDAGAILENNFCRLLPSYILPISTLASLPGAVSPAGTVTCRGTMAYRGGGEEFSAGLERSRSRATAWERGICEAPASHTVRSGASEIVGSQAGAWEPEERECRMSNVECRMGGEAQRALESDGHVVATSRLLVETGLDKPAACRHGRGAGAPE